MTQSQIISQSNLYMALMDLKQDIQRLKYQNKKLQDQIQKCDKVSSKTYRDMNQKFQEVVKLSTNSFIQVANQNDLLKKQNQIHQNLTQSNQDLVKNIKEENIKLNGIFYEQKNEIDRVTKANQVIVNQELTAICKKQEQMIRDQILEYNKQNQFIQEQKAKIQLSFQAVANFEQRNVTLQQKLLQQKDEIQKYIVEATKQNQSLVIDLIFRKYEQAQNNFRNNVKNIENMRDQFDYNKNCSLNELNEIVRRSQYSFGNLYNQIEGFKNECCSMRYQCEHFCNQQNNHVNRTRQQLQKIQHQRKKIERKCSEMDKQMQKLRREQHQNLRNMQSKTETKIRDSQSKLRQIQSKVDRLNHEVQRKVQQQIRKHNHKIHRQIEQVKSTCNNKICTLEKNFNVIESKVEELKNK